MFNGAFALLERSLRIDARAWSTHLARLGLMGAIYFSLLYALLTSFMFGAPGLHFFTGIAYLDVTFMTLLGFGFFSTSITEEKEEDTLGLMLMAGISPLGILAGKSGGRLWQSLLLIAVQYPFVQLAVTLGGVMGSQVWSVTISLLAYMIFLGGFGLLCSTLAPRSQTATAWMIFGVILYFVVPMFAKAWYADYESSLVNMDGTRKSVSLMWTLIGGLGDICVFLEMGNILSTGFGNSTFSIQVVSNLLTGIACAGLAWLWFDVAARSPSTESSSRGLVGRRRGLFLFSAGRTWNNPFLWKDFHFVSGGDGMLLFRSVYYGGMAVTALVIENKFDNPEMGWYWLLIFLIWFSVTIDAGRVLSRSLQDEVRGQTLASLMMLPRSEVGTVYAKFAGALIGWLPGPIFGLAVICFSPAMHEIFGNLLDGDGTGLAVMIMMVLYFSLIPHFAALVSLYVRWGAVALAIAMTIGVYFFLIMGFFMVASLFAGMGFNGPGGSQELLFAAISFVLLALCAACHIGVILRVQALGSK